MDEFQEFKNDYLTPELYQYFFDGNLLKEYNQNGVQTNSWPAMSGDIHHQRAIYQDQAGKGPIPEGDYTFQKQGFQSYDDLSFWQKVVSKIGAGRFPGGIRPWGRYRVDLNPTLGTNTYNRQGIMLHGGNEYGSAGCIDLENQIDNFYNHIRQHPQSEFPLTVEYDHLKPFMWDKKWGQYYNQYDDPFFIYRMLY